MALILHSMLLLPTDTASIRFFSWGSFAVVCIYSRHDFYGQYPHFAPRSIPPISILPVSRWLSLKSKVENISSAVDFCFPSSSSSSCKQFKPSASPLNIFVAGADLWRRRRAGYPNTDFTYLPLRYCGWPSPRRLPCLSRS